MSLHLFQIEIHPTNTLENTRSQLAMGGVKTEIRNNKLFQVVEVPDVIKQQPKLCFDWSECGIDRERCKREDKFVKQPVKELEWGDDIDLDFSDETLDSFFTKKKTKKPGRPRSCVR